MNGAGSLSCYYGYCKTILHVEVCHVCCDNDHDELDSMNFKACKIIGAESISPLLEILSDHFLSDVTPKMNVVQLKGHDFLSRHYPLRHNP